MTASPAFELFLKKISTARAEADALISAHPQSLEGLSDATVIMLWHALYDTLLRGGEEEECVFHFG